MKKKFLLGMIPALLALSSCGFAKAEAEPRVKEYLEDTLAHEEIFGEVEEQPVIREPRRAVDPGYPAPAVGLQYDTTSNPGYTHLRFTAAIRIEDGEMAYTNAVWHRTMFKPDGTVKKEEVSFPSAKAYTSLNDGGASNTTQIILTLLFIQC